MRKLLPVILGLFGLIAGAGAGYVLRPAAEIAADGQSGSGGVDAAAENASPEPAAASTRQEPAASGSGSAETGGEPNEAQDADPAAPTEFVKLNNQFVVPVIRGNEVSALVILSITLEVETGASEAVFAAEPKLRDSFLQVLFDHANAKGFDGAFTQSSRMAQLRKALLEPARTILGNLVGDVLIVDIVRQDS
ncbi:flagellar basal body-associated FliL family protein [Albidovulum sp.]|uniref:flagellar basal body-associated FliL family protein n=1 Tax=Albidovulum sp. TaxID=1872424 RepID=UPI003D7E5708